MNLKLEIFKTELYNLINQIELPIGVIKLLLQDVLTDVNVLYENQLKKQQENQVIGTIPGKMGEWIPKTVEEQKQELSDEEDSSENKEQDKLN